MKEQRTYWHLEGRGRVPQSYDIKTSRLLYHPERGFEVPTPGGDWLTRHALHSRLRARFVQFRDPSELTYTRYVERRAEQEAFVEQLLAGAEAPGGDDRLADDWFGVLEAVLPVLRYPSQALHMLAAYVAHLAPESRVVVAGAFQAADELRRLECWCRRMRQLQLRRAEFGRGAREQWQTHAAWQPLREVLERLLVTYDFGEALVALNLVVKPALDELFMVGFAELGLERGDHLLSQLARALYRDCQWQQNWTRALIECAYAEAEDNRALVAEWCARWWPPTQAALCALVGIWGVDAVRRDREVNRVRCRYEAWRSGTAAPE
jgi:toluene monooxygenase system protein E